MNGTIPTEMYVRFQMTTRQLLKRGIECAVMFGVMFSCTVFDYCIQLTHFSVRVPITLPDGRMVQFLFTSCFQRQTLWFTIPVSPWIHDWHHTDGNVRFSLK
jgi:hypothetical protein